MQVSKCERSVLPRKNIHNRNIAVSLEKSSKALWISVFENEGDCGFSSAC